jgi:hypothetical protein
MKIIHPSSFFLSKAEIHDLFIQPMPILNISLRGFTLSAALNTV